MRAATVGRIQGNKVVTFARLQSMTELLHLHGADSLNFSGQLCDENFFLALCISRGNGCFAHRLSQARNRNDRQRNGWTRWQLGF
jgi:hypothetical protein